MSTSKSSTKFIIFVQVKNKSDGRDVGTGGESADDEAHSRPGSSLTVSASPDISVSPITANSGGGGLKPGGQTDQLRQRLLRRTSTPGRKRPDEKTSSEEGDPQSTSSTRKRQRKLGTVEKPSIVVEEEVIDTSKEDDNVFKLPSSVVAPSSSRDTSSVVDKSAGATDDTYVNLLVTVKASQVAKLVCANSLQLKMGSLEQMNENFQMYKKAAPQFLKRGRESDASSLSSYSR